MAVTTKLSKGSKQQKSPNLTWANLLLDHEVMEYSLEFGKRAYMHEFFWQHRNKGFGSGFIFPRMTFKQYCNIIKKDKDRINKIVTPEVNHAQLLPIFIKSLNHYTNLKNPNGKIVHDAKTFVNWVKNEYSTNRLSDLANENYPLYFNLLYFLYKNRSIINIGDYEGEKLLRVNSMLTMLDVMETMDKYAKKENYDALLGDISKHIVDVLLKIYSGLTPHKETWARGMWPFFFVINPTSDSTARLYFSIYVPEEYNSQIYDSLGRGPILKLKGIYGGNILASELRKDLSSKWHDYAPLKIEAAKSGRSSKGIRTEYIINRDVIYLQFKVDVGRIKKVRHSKPLGNIDYFTFEIIYYLLL